MFNLWRITLDNRAKLPFMKSNPVGRGMAIMLVATGLGHFVYPRGLDSIVPRFLPGTPRLWTYLSGIAELIVAGMLLAPLHKYLLDRRVRLLGTYAALALFIGVYPANINMAIRWSDRPMPAPLLAYARLPLQFILFYWAWRLSKKIKRV